MGGVKLHNFAFRGLPFYRREIYLAETGRSGRRRPKRPEVRGNKMYTYWLYSLSVVTISMNVASYGTSGPEIS